EVASIFGFETDDSNKEGAENTEPKVILTQSHLQDEVSSLSNKVDNWESSLAKKVSRKLEEAVPRMVVDAFEERMPELLSNTLKNILPNIIEDSIQQAILKIVQRVQETKKANPDPDTTDLNLQIPGPTQGEQQLNNDEMASVQKEHLSWQESTRIPPPPQLSSFGLSTAEKKRKRSLEIIKEVFIKEYIIVDGMHRNLIPPQVVVGSRGLVIEEPESRIFFYIGNFDLVFPREEEFYLATTAQLIRIQSAIQRGTLEAEEMFKKIELTIEARNDVTKARRIVKENLDGLGQNM
nr:hypothetical protein [Tanacetum cinerariifolium]